MPVPGVPKDEGFVAPAKPTTGGPWYPIRKWVVFKGHKNYVVVGWTQKQPNDIPKPPPSPGNVVYVGGGGGSANPGLSAYIQRYRVMFGRNVSPPSALLKKAEAGNWSLAYWDMQVRLKDPKYYTSDEAKQRILPFKKTMESLFPNIAGKMNPMKNSKFYQNLAMKYLKHGWNSDQLLENISKTRLWRKANPEYVSYLQGQRALGTATEANPLMYKQYVNSLKNAFAEYGMDMPTDYLRSFFRSRYASKSGFSDFSTNLSNLAQAAPSYNLWSGEGLTKEQTGEVLFGGKQQSDLRQQLARAFQVESSMAQSRVKGPEISLDQKRLIQPLL